MTKIGIAQAHRRHAADAHAAPRTGLRTRGDHEVGRAGRQQIVDVLDRRRRDGLRGVDRRHGVTDFHATLLAGGRGNDGREADRERNHRELDIHRRTGGDGHGLLLLRVTDA
jgi:hypothetical protein